MVLEPRFTLNSSQDKNQVPVGTGELHKCSDRDVSAAGKFGVKALYGVRDELRVVRRFKFCSDYG